MFQIMHIDISGLLGAMLVLAGIPLVAIIGFALLGVSSGDRVRFFRALGTGVGMSIVIIVSLVLWWWAWWDWLAYRGAGWGALILGTVAIIGLGIWIAILLVRWAGSKRTRAEEQ